MSIQSLEDLLGDCVLQQGGNSDNYLPLVEFTFNHNFHSSIGLTLFETLYDRRCKIPLYWYDSIESSVLRPEVVQQSQMRESDERVVSDFNLFR